MKTRRERAEIGLKAYGTMVNVAASWKEGECWLCMKKGEVTTVRGRTRDFSLCRECYKEDAEAIRKGIYFDPDK